MSNELSPNSDLMASLVYLALDEKRQQGSHGELKVNGIKFGVEELKVLKIASDEVLKFMEDGYELCGGIDDSPYLVNNQSDGPSIPLEKGADGFVISKH